MRRFLATLVLLVSVPFVRAQPTQSSVSLPTGNLVVNGGFESGFDGWLGTYGIEAPPAPALEGIHSGVVIDVGSSSVGQPMWQVLTTTAGLQYDFRFSLLSGFGWVGEQSKGNAGSPVNVYWGGGLLGAGSQFLGTFDNTSTTTWQTYDLHVTATSSSTMIQFVDFNDQRWQLIDAVSVVATPEPTITSLILGGLIALAIYNVKSSRRFRAREYTVRRA